MNWFSGTYQQVDILDHKEQQLKLNEKKTNILEGQLKITEEELVSTNERVSKLSVREIPNQVIRIEIEYMVFLDLCIQDLMAEKQAHLMLIEFLGTQ